MKIELLLSRIYDIYFVKYFKIFIYDPHIKIVLLNYYRIVFRHICNFL